MSIGGGDLDCLWGTDLQASPSGDFNTVTGDVLSRQRVLRRLLTNPRVVLDTGEILDCDYLEDPSYGAGLGREVGASIGLNDQAELQAFITRAMKAEDTVNQNIPPVVQLYIVRGGMRMRISYYTTGGTQVVLPSMIVN